MKKVFLLTIAILITSNVVLACDGIVIKGKYCLSKQQMNWYSASAWCQAQGMNLIDLKQECGSLTQCKAITLSSDEQEKVIAAGGRINAGWTRNSESTTRAYALLPSAGSVAAYSRTHIFVEALCQ